MKKNYFWISSRYNNEFEFCLLFQLNTWPRIIFYDVMADWEIGQLLGGN